MSSMQLTKGNFQDVELYIYLILSLIIIFILRLASINIYLNSEVQDLKIKIESYVFN